MTAEQTDLIVFGIIAALALFSGGFLYFNA